MFGIVSGLVTLPSAALLSTLPKKVNVGTILFGTMLSAGLASGVMSLYYSNHRHVLRNSLFIFAGALDAFSEELQFHYSSVKSIFPDMKDQFFNPAISWKNKYTSKIPFATTLMVGTTDGYHAARALNKIFVVGGMLTFDRNISFKKQLKQVLISSFFYTMAKGSVHYIVNH